MIDSTLPQNIEVPETPSLRERHPGLLVRDYVEAIVGL